MVEQNPIDKVLEPGANSDSDISEFQAVLLLTCMNKQLDQLTVCHQKLGDQVNIPVSPTPIRLVRCWHPELGEEVLQGGEGSGLPTIIFIPEENR